MHAAQLMKITKSLSEAMAKRTNQTQLWLRGQLSHSQISKAGVVAQNRYIKNIYEQTINDNRV